jgi:hypothetical protein
MSAKAMGLTKMIVNEQTLSGIIGRMPGADWKQWAKEVTVLMQVEVSSAYEGLCIKSGVIHSTSHQPNHMG